MDKQDIYEEAVKEESLHLQEEVASSTEELASSTHRMAISAAKSAKYTKWIAIATFIVASIALINSAVTCYLLFRE